ncbi:natural killer cells antigen CD94 [Kryptolebias marmoratus]|uniref:Natural killer cells antigen CD94-like n=1 Tax=Kryptolebias marmoratus TaxID=37003 RepID=A0A3Q2ZHN6_KRYMA|nr:natural killer cells antigen CD94 [Kryptolebias marmoratus]
MDEELNYATVTFKTNGVAEFRKSNSLEIIYDEVKLWDAHPIISENKRKAHIFSLHRLVLVSLGIICIILASVIISLSISFTYKHRRQNMTFTMQNLKLQAENEALKRRTEELVRERDQLNWTIGVILQYDNFPVKEHCPQKSCKPCLDDWVLFQSNCYLFTNHDYYSQWKNWEKSREFCQEQKADLVVIESLEEQEFINNHTTEYSDPKHGYWIGLRDKSMMETWTWVDGSNVTVMFWSAEQPAYRSSCALSNPHADPSSTWVKQGCDMRNRWICEGRALIRNP